jgi:hypothetical protein
MNALKKSNKWVKGLVGVFIVLLVALIIYWIYKAYKTASQGDAENPILVAGTVDASESGNSKSWDLPESSSANSPNMAFTLSFWMYIADWNYRFGEPKAILVKGKKESAAPGIYLAPNKNNLIIQTKAMTRAENLPTCNISNIPLQKWVHVAYVLDNRTVDVYINGKLERSCVLTAVPALNNEKLKLFPKGRSGLTGFLGQLSSLRYFSSALRPVDVANIYNEGPRSTMYETSSDHDGSSDGESCYYSPEQIEETQSALQAAQDQLQTLYDSEQTPEQKQKWVTTLTNYGEEPSVNTTEGFQHYARMY